MTETANYSLENPLANSALTAGPPQSATTAAPAGIYDKALELGAELKARPFEGGGPRRVLT